MSPVKRIRINLRKYEKIIRANVKDDSGSLWTSTIRGKKPGSWCKIYCRGNDRRPLAMWENTGHGWVWDSWKMPNFFKKVLTKTLALFIL